MMFVEATRGTLVESRHAVSAAIVRADGTVLDAWGDVETPVYPRSALKPLQALPLLASGAAERLRLDPARIALACASHNGEAIHVDGVRAWLADLGLPPTALECGTHPAIDDDTAQQMRALQQAPGPEHNNCSGKHCGMLSLALHRDIATAGYIRHGHPVQHELRELLSPVLQLDLAKAPWGVDGCGIPTYGVPLKQLAHAIAQLAAPENLPAATRAAGRQVADAMSAAPYLVAGRNRFDTALMQHRPGTLLIKGGAEGVCVAGLRDRGVGIALKIGDGARRAVDVAMAALLRKAGALDDDDLAALATYAAPVLRNVAGDPVGALRAAFND
jgi:L-asparaginase II